MDSAWPGGEMDQMDGDEDGAKKNKNGFSMGEAIWENMSHLDISGLIWLGKFWNMNLMEIHSLGHEISSQLTTSYFSEGLKL